jgi:hypothetical protein
MTRVMVQMTAIVQLWTLGCQGQEIGSLVDGGVSFDASLSDGGVLFGDPFDPVSVAERHAVAICDFRRRCLPVLSEFDRDGERCLSDNKDILVATYLAHERVIQAGRAAYSQRGLDSCVRAYAEATCSEFAREDACSAMFVGNAGAGTGCGAQIECAAGLYCSAADGECGQCKPYLGPGASCLDDTGLIGLCEPGFMCDAGTCVSQSQPKGAACGTRETGLCSGALQCVGAEEGVCTEADGRVGAACSIEAVVSCNVYVGTQCGPAGLCERITWVQAGAACGSSTPTRLCVPGTYCNETSCVALPDLGEACLLGYCGLGAYCSSGKCAEQHKDGEACVNDGRRCFRSATGALICDAEDTKRECGDTAIPPGVLCMRSDPCRGPSECISGSCSAMSMRTDCR